MSRLVFPCLLGLGLTAGCFNPDSPAGSGETDTSGTDDTTGMDMSRTTTDADSSSTLDPTPGSNTLTGSTSSATTLDDGSSSSTGEPPPPGWGEGEPPDFGDLGPEGDGAVLVVHALDIDEAVDVWFVGDTEPTATNLSRNDAVRLEGIPRDARRLVLARTGTLEAVGCSQWFPLRAEEQWAVVAAREEHTCPIPSPDGASVTFEQSLVLDSNPVRYVHAAAPDDLSVIRNDVAEPGGLVPLEENSGTDLPDCSASGCIVALTIQGTPQGTTTAYDFTFAVTSAAEVPPPGEMLFVPMGDIREDWPSEPDALSILAVDIEGDVRHIRRNPDLAVAAPGIFQHVEFTVPAPPGVFNFADAPPCGKQSCPLQAVNFQPGDYFITGMSSDQSYVDEYTLEAGHRYVLAYRPEGMILIEDTLSHADQQIALAAGINYSEMNTLTLGRVFAGSGEAFDELVDIAAFGVSDGVAEVPADGWDMVTSVNGGALGTDCFHPVTTPPGWRGYLNPQAILDLSSWPPRETGVPQLCF